MQQILNFNTKLNKKLNVKLKQKNRSKISWYEISICWPKCKRKSTAIEEQLHIQAGNKMKISQWIMAERGGRKILSCESRIGKTLQTLQTLYEVLRSYKSQLGINYNKS